MSKWSKKISLLLVLALSTVLLFNLFSGPKESRNNDIDNSHIYASKTDPIVLDIPDGEYVSKSPKDDALKYAQFWKIPEIYRKSSEGCMNNYLEFHPTNYVKREGVFEYYGIKIGTDAWKELVIAYENQAINVCYSYSGYEAEDLWAQKIRDTFSPSELKEILAFHETDLGRKLIDTSNAIGQEVQKTVATRQAESLKRESAIFEKEKDRLYKKHIQEDGNWFDKFWHKLFYK
jgi:hypothetical protein